jgi:pilus assembly protein CpaB
VRRGVRACALGGLAIALGGIAASDVADREAALRRRLGPLEPVLYARAAIERGAVIRRGDLATRRVPGRYAPRAALAAAAQAQGARAAVDIPAGGDVAAAMLAIDDAGGPLTAASPRERVVRVVAIGSPAELAPGSRADVIATADSQRGGQGAGVVLRGATVVEASPAGGESEGGGLPHVAAALRVTLGEALSLARAQAGARELQLLARPPSADGR